MENLKRYSSFIKCIITAPEPIRKKLLKTSNLSIIKAIFDLLLNVIQKNTTVSKSVLRNLKKHKTILYKLLKTKGFGQEKIS